MLFDIVDLRIFADVEGVDAVVLGVAVAAVVDAAARDDGHVRALADKEVVVDQIVEAGLAQDDRNVDVFGLGDDLDVLGVLAELLLPVEADVDRAVGDGDHVGDGLQDAFLDVVQHVPFTSSRLQPATVWDSRRG